MAHCTDEMKEHWRVALKKHGIDVDKEAADASNRGNQPV